jgi:hypothetical protein
LDTLYFSGLFVCLAASIIASLSRHSKPFTKAFVILLVVAVTVELGNVYLIFPAIHQSNHWTFNIETIFEFYFFSYFFYHALRRKRHRKLIIIFVYAYPVILIFSFLTIQHYYYFHTYTYMLGELYLIVLCLLYYRELYTADEFKKLSTLPEFWIVTGLFIFSAGELPYMLLLNYLNKHYILTSMYFKEYILGTLNIVMYAMFTIGLLWSTRPQK